MTSQAVGPPAVMDINIGYNGVANQRDNTHQEELAAVVNNNVDGAAAPEEEEGDSNSSSNNININDNGAPLDISDSNTTTYDPARMEITATEISWANGLRNALEQQQLGSELNLRLNDFWLAQLAIVNRDDFETSLEQAANLQHFRQEYDIRDSLSDAKQTMWQFLNLFDDWILNFAYSQHFQSYVLVIDVGKIDVRETLTTSSAWRTYLAGMYYLRQALNADLLSIGNGITIMYESEGFEFMSKFGGPYHVKRLAGELFQNYPCLHHKMMHFHTSMFYHIMMTIAKPFLSDEMREKFEFGCTSALGRLDRLYLIPDPQSAKIRNYQRIMETLQRRYHHETNFRLN